MTSTRVIRHESELTPAWLSQVLGREVASIGIVQGHGNWSRQLSIAAAMADGSSLSLRLKLCLGDTFGRSELDYYMRDYRGMANAPLVRCFDAAHDPAVGYHLLLEDLSATHVDQRDLPPTLSHGLAVAEALGRLHRHHWCSMPAPAEAVLDRYFDEIRPGLAPMEQATGVALRQDFLRHEAAFRRRWAEPRGMSLLHGDLNPTNVLAPRAGDTPVYFLDRQPFEWSLTYGVAASDLAYAVIPWWPPAARREFEEAVLRRWHEALDRPEYGWSEALADWRLSVVQCLNVPMEWCARPSTLQGMRWLWEAQFTRVRAAIAELAG